MSLNFNDRASDHLIIIATELNYHGYFSTTQDVVDFFEKPWKWEQEYEESIGKEK